MHRVDVEGGGCGCVSTRSMATTLRTFLVLLAGGVTLLILMWMLHEQDMIRSCVHYPTHIANHRQAGSGQSQLDTSRNAANLNSSAGLWDYNWDKKAWKTKEEGNGIPARTLVLVRHGQYDFNTGLLTDLGRAQANLTGRRLAAINNKYKIIIHSTMIRAQQTAELIHAHLPGLPVIADDMIQEGGPVPPKPTITYWGLPERTYHIDGPRMEAAFRKYFFRADKSQTQQTFEILVGHGNIFRFFALRALQLTKEAWMRVFIAHASISYIHIWADGTVTMTRFGDSGHFPPNMVTY